MKSEFRLIAPSFKLTFTIGLFATIVIITLALVYRMETSLILLATAGTVAGVGVVAVIGRVYALSHNKEVARLELAERQQKVRLATYQANKAEFESRIIAIPSSQRVLMAEDAPIRIIEATPGNGYKLLDPAQAAPVDLLAALDSQQRVLIVGPSNAGKTNLMLWLAARRLATSQVLVVDPHAFPDKWAGCQVVGLGSNHAEIEATLDKLVSVMVGRYQEIAQGRVREGDHSRLTVMVDEWMSIAYQCKNATETIVRLLTESRKAAFTVIIGSHSERVKSLGLDGRGDLRDGFAVVRLSITNGQRLATLDTGSGEVPAILPGAFVAQAAPGDNVGFPVDLTPADLSDPLPTPAAAFILRLHSEGASLNEIARQVYASTGGKQVELIKRVIERYN